MSRLWALIGKESVQPDELNEPRQNSLERLTVSGDCVRNIGRMSVLEIGMAYD